MSHKEFHREFKAHMYLMWRHVSADSIWVPINVTDWGFDFTVKKTLNVWGFVGTPSFSATSQDTEEFPEWNRIYVNGPFTTDP